MVPTVKRTRSLASLLVTPRFCCFCSLQKARRGRSAPLGRFTLDHILTCAHTHLDSSHTHIKHATEVQKLNS